MRKAIDDYEKVKKPRSLPSGVSLTEKHTRARSQEMKGKQGSSREHTEAALVVENARAELTEATKEVFAMGVCVSFAPAEGGEPVQGDYHERETIQPYHRTSIKT
jgi:hypothetical protein